MSLFLLFVLSVLLPVSAEGTQLFVQAGSQVTLDISYALKDYVSVVWSIDEYVLATSDKHSTDFLRGRCVLQPQNCSLTLINVQQEQHSGLYQALLFTWTEEIIYQCFVTVSGPEAKVLTRKYVQQECAAVKEFQWKRQEENNNKPPVSAVSLSLDSVSKSSESCNFTVSCKTELFSISRSFTCDTHSCEEPRPQCSGHAHSDSSLDLNLFNGVIVCNHSNHVSWTQDTRDIPHECIVRNTGSTSQTVFVETDRDLLLEITDDGYIKRNEIFLWKHSSGHIIVRAVADRITINDDYKDRVEYCPQNRSLMVRNVRLSDSGIYTAAVHRTSDEPLLFYNVSVEAPVSAVSLSLDSVSKSSESCNFTVSCKTELFSISRSFTCDTHSCEEPRPQPSGHAHPGSSSLHLHLSNLSIICNHSNHVSWTQNTEDIQQMCISGQSQTGPDLVFGLSVCVLKTVVYGVGLLLMLSALIIVHVLEHRSKQV